MPDPILAFPAQSCCRPRTTWHCPHPLASHGALARLCHRAGLYAAMQSLLTLVFARRSQPIPASLNFSKSSQIMSYGGNVEGYLLKIDGDEVRIVYCILDEGVLQYFSRMGGELLGAIALSGSKVDVFLLPSLDEIGQVPNQFRVDAQSRIPSVRRRGAPQPVETDKLVSMTFAGTTREVTDQWAVSILNWNRYSWEDGQMVCSSKDEYHNLQKLIELTDTKHDKTATDPVVPVGVSPAVLPL